MCVVIWCSVLKVGLRSQLSLGYCMSLKFRKSSLSCEVYNFKKSLQNYFSKVFETLPTKDIQCFTLEEYNGHFFTFCHISPRPYKYLTQVIYQNDLQGLLFNLIMIISCHVRVSCYGRASKIDSLEKC